MGHVQAPSAGRRVRRERTIEESAGQTKQKLTNGFSNCSNPLCADQECAEQNSADPEDSHIANDTEHEAVSPYKQYMYMPLRVVATYEKPHGKHGNERDAVYIAEIERKRVSLA